MCAGRSARARDRSIDDDVGDALQIIERSLRHRGPRVGGDNQRGVGFLADEQVHGREFARIRAGIAAGEIDAEGISRHPAHDVVRAGLVAVIAHGHGDELREGVQRRGQREDRRDVHVLSPRHGQSGASNHAPAPSDYTTRLSMISPIAKTRTPATIKTTDTTSEGPETSALPKMPPPERLARPAAWTAICTVPPAAK